MIATAPTGGGSPVAVLAANQPWVDQYENWTPDRKIVQFRAAADWIGGNPANLHTVIPNRYGYDLTLDGQNILVRLRMDEWRICWLCNPRETQQPFNWN